MLLLVFALLGLGASVASSYVHYQMLADPTYTSFCDVSATVSCTQAYLSRTAASSVCRWRSLASSSSLSSR